MTLRSAPILLAMLPLCGPALAHPHVFIDTAFDLVFDAEGRLEGVRIEWSYDDFYSLLLVEENALDADGDGVPEPRRLDAFAGGDVDWAAGFPGDFTVTHDGTPLPLRPPTEHEASWRDDRYVTTHLMTLAEPVAVDGHTIVARAYDPTYFVAYDVPTAPGIVGRDDCTLSREAADRDAAMAEYGEALAEVDMLSDPFEAVDLPDIGILFSDAFELACAAPS
ncbi:polyphosphate kinase [Palleronia aestuarii]|uniref:Polyphosphate kinase n=1 Tax=Palleronia aestuarii TaxID=568105 RepID=A0A2W7N9U7_9RHOB|nr:DUF1007 family protein [Palleronia aestuarii]PZX17011.1 polyphosphate kinase [Palleronia aestuarii]